MIIVKLIGGMGNQLFQYAAGRRLACFHNVPLKLDVSGFGTYKLHKYSLQAFNIVQDFADPEDVAGFQHRAGILGKSAGYLLGKVGRPRAILHVKEKCFCFDPRILQERDNVYLDGYWQSEKYFKDIESVIKEDLVFKREPDAVNLEAIRQIKGCAAVSVHIRRGDYVSNPAANSVHGTASLEYYRSAMRFVASKIPDSHFFLFSDDPDWVKKNIPFEYPFTLLTHNNAEKNYEDLRLMSLCQHNIVANSSFSWWGAWLNPNPVKIVIAPKKWFHDTSMDSKDLVPEDWKRL